MVVELFLQPIAHSLQPTAYSLPISGAVHFWQLLWWGGFFLPQWLQTWILLCFRRQMRR